MKTLLKTNVILLLGIVALWGCEENVTPLQHTAPQVRFPVQETSLTAVVGDPVEFRADIESGDKLTCGWYVDGTLEASTAEMTYTFSAPGDYEVRFEARNGAGKVEKSYAVKVADVLKLHLSVGASTRIVRRQLEVLKGMAVVDAGADVVHEWKVDGEVKSDKAYFDTFVLPDARVYTVAYAGSNAAGTFRKSFEVQAPERPLEIGFSNNDETIACQDGAVVEIIATVKYGGTGVQHEWKVDGETVSTDAVFSRAFDGKGPYTIAYHAVNSKQETVDRTWTVTMVPSGALFEHFEDYTELPKWWTLKQNTPGIELADNPKPEGINTSLKVLRDNVTGTGSTSGYFDLKLKDIPVDKIDVTKYTGIRFKVYLGKNKYYPHMDYAGKKYASVTDPQFKDEWEVLEYRFDTKLDPTKNLTFRPLYQKNGTNIPSGPVTETNTRTVYIDDIEFLE